jgi:hypothetical protein
MISAGRFRGFLESPEIAVSAKQSTPGFKCTARIADKEAGADNNSRIEMELWLTEGAAERAIQSLIYAGCTFPSKPGETEPDLTNFEGCGSQEVELQIEIEEYTPEPTEANPNPRTSKRPRVAFVNRVGASRTMKAIDDNQKKMIAKQFGGLVNKVRANLASPAKSDASFDTKAMDAAGEPKKKLY